MFKNVMYLRTANSHVNGVYMFGSDNVWNKSTNLWKVGGFHCFKVEHCNRLQIYFVLDFTLLKFVETVHKGGGSSFSSTCFRFSFI